MNSLRIRKGFTLLELTIALTVFVIFVTVIFSSVFFLMKAQREANEERKVYEESQFLLEFLAQNIRTGTPDYDCYENPSDLCNGQNLVTNKGLSDGILALLLANGGERIIFKKGDDGSLGFLRQISTPLGFQNVTGFTDFKVLNQDTIFVESLQFFITPVKNSFIALEDNQYQYQPRVTVFMDLKGKSRIRPQGILLSVQTTFSSRVYNRL